MANDALWNGFIQFYSDNYLLFTVVSFIESNSMRFGAQYSQTENFCSVLSILGMLLSVLFPCVIFILYWKKLEWVDPNKDKLTKLKFLMSQYQNTPGSYYKLLALLRPENMAISLFETE